MATKWGVLSAGRITHDFVNVVQALPHADHQFVAVAEWKLEPAQKFAVHHNIPRAYGSFEELATNPEVEVVYLAIVNSYHYSKAKLMLENGKHVLIEKPMTWNEKQAQELISLAKCKNLFLMEGMWSRFLPLYRLINQQIKTGVIGDVYHININVGCPNIDSPRINKNELGGGTILDMGVYAIDIISQVFKNEEPEHIKAIGHLNADGVDVDCSAVFSFKGNRTVTVSTHSMIAQGSTHLWHYRSHSRLERGTPTPPGRVDSLEIIRGIEDSEVENKEVVKPDALTEQDSSSGANRKDYSSDEDWDQSPLSQ